MDWKPAKVLGMVVGMLIILTILGIDLFLIRNIAGQPFGLNLYLTMLLTICTLPLLALWIYWYYGLATLRYHLDRNELVIISGTTRYAIPLQSIRRIRRGNEYTETAHFRGIVWSGYMRGRTQSAEVGPIEIHSTQPLTRQLVVETDNQCYGISPRHTDRFLDDFDRRCALGVMRESEPAKTRVGLAALPLWRDRGFWALWIAVFITNAALFGMIAERYTSLAARLSIHSNLPGQVALIIPKSGILIVPAIGAVVLVIDSILGILLHHRERVGAWLISLVALGIQGVLWVAALGIVGI